MIKFIKGFFIFLNAFTKIGKYKLWTFLWITAFISLALGLGLIFGLKTLLPIISTSLLALYPFDFGESFLLNYGTYFIRALSFIIIFFIYKYILLIVLSPIQSLVSQRIEFHLTNQKPSNSISKLPQEIIRGISFSLISLSKELFYTFILFLLGLIPILSIFSAIGIFLLQAYFMGLGSFDYYSERYHSIGRTIAIGRKNRAILAGIGSGFNLLLFIPVIGLMFAPLLATIATTEEAVLGGIVEDS